MKKETIRKYLHFLAKTAYQSSANPKKGQSIEQVQNDHIQFLERLREDHSVDPNFIIDLERVKLIENRKTKDTKSGSINSVFRYIPFIGNAALGFFSSFTFGDALNNQMTHTVLDEYYHEIMAIAEKYEFGIFSDTNY